MGNDYRGPAGALRGGMWTGKPPVVGPLAAWAETSA